MHRDGTPIPVLLTTALVDGDDGTHFFTQLQDLRDRHRADRFSQADRRAEPRRARAARRAGADAPRRGDRAGRRRRGRLLRRACATSATARCASSPTRPASSPSSRAATGRRPATRWRSRRPWSPTTSQHEERFSNAPALREMGPLPRVERAGPLERAAPCSSCTGRCSDPSSPTRTCASWRRSPTCSPPRWIARTPRPSRAAARCTTR